MILVYIVGAIFLLIVLILIILNVSECLLKIAQGIVKEISFINKRLKLRNIKLDLDQALKAATAKQIANAASNTHTILYGGGAVGPGRGNLVPNTNQHYNIGATVTINGQQNAFSPGINIIDRTKFDVSDAKEWLELVTAKIETLEKTIENESDDSKKKELKLTLLTLKYLSVECERML